MIKNILSNVYSAFELGEDNRRIAQALVALVFFLLIGKFAGAAKEMAVAYRFGVGGLVDAFVLVLTFVTWIPAVWTSVLNSVFVPLINKVEPDEKKHFNEQLMGATLLASGFLTMSFIFLGPIVVDKFATDASDEARIWLRQFVIGLAPLAGFGFLVAQLSVLLLAAERHVNTLYTSVAPLVLMLAILLWPDSARTNPNSLIWGSILGVALQLLGLYFLLGNKASPMRASFNFDSPVWVRFKSGIGIMVLAQFVMSFVDPISSLIAANLGSGNVASLGYTLAILALFLSLGATAVSRAILPVLSSSQNENQRSVTVAMQWSVLMFVAGIILAIAVWFLAPIIVKIIYERGAFTTDNTLAVTEGVRFGVFQFPFYFAGIVMAQLFASLGKYRLILGSGVLALIVKVVLSYFLADYFGFSGIILASAFMYFATSLYFVFHITRER